MFLTIAKNFTRGNKVYSPYTITNENGKGKPFFSYSMIFLRLFFCWRKSCHICNSLMMRVGALHALSDNGHRASTSGQLQVSACKSSHYFS